MFAPNTHRWWFWRSCQTWPCKIGGFDLLRLISGGLRCFMLLHGYEYHARYTADRALKSQAGLEFSCARTLHGQVPSFYCSFPWSIRPLRATMCLADRNGPLDVNQSMFISRGRSRVTNSESQRYVPQGTLRTIAGHMSKKAMLSAVRTTADHNTPRAMDRIHYNQARAGAV